MPITPFHMGPGLVFKSIGGREFSLMVFGFSQVAIDVEPLVGVLRGAHVLHGFSHTWLGATVIGVASAVVGRPVCMGLARFVRQGGNGSTLARLPWPEGISWRAAMIGAFVGTYSHIVLDGMMHLDMHPLAPFSSANALLGLLSVRALYLLCVASGIVGAVVMSTSDRWR